MTEVPAASLYVGTVTHVRRRPQRHRLDYGVFAMLLDIDRIDELARRSRLFSHNRFGLLSFRDVDHGDRQSTPRAWIDRQLDQAGLPRAARVDLLCYPRLLGFVFNPLSVWFCHDASGALSAVVHEVHNTFGDRHAYVLPVGSGGKGGLVRQETAKQFFVSPFLAVEGRYRFRIRPPGERLAIVITHSDGDGPLLDAGFHAEHRAFTARNVWRSLLRHPLMTHKVLAGIHWEALKLWLKGVPFLGRPAQARDDRTVRRPSA